MAVRRRELLSAGPVDVFAVGAVKIGCMTTSKGLRAVLVVGGLLLLVVAVVYFTQPATSLPPFLPGSDPTLARHHTTHALAALALGVVCFIGAWMTSPRSNPPTP